MRRLGPRGVGSREPKVSNFYSALVVHQYVFWFDVTVDDAHFVEAVQSNEHIIKYGLYVGLIESLAMIHKMFQIIVDIFHNKA